jgi:FMN phosphatase YigB (HAD superfamily)
VDYEGACAAGLRGVLLVREGSAVPADPSITTVRSLHELPSLVDGAKK